MSGKKRVVTHPRISEGTKRGIASKRAKQELEREAKRLRPSDLVAFEQTGLVADRLKPLIALAGVEAQLVLEGLGGEENVTPQRRILLEDFTRLGVALRAVTGLMLQGGEDAGELASRIATLANARRGHLQALGLARFEKALDPTKPLEVEFETDDSTDGVSFPPSASGSHAAGAASPASRPSGDAGPRTNRFEET